MGTFGASFFIIVFAIALFLIICKWKIYEKAGKPGWAAIIPIYDTLIMLEIIRKPWWWLLLMLIPIVNIVYAVWALNLLSKSFGKDEGFTVGLILLPIVFYPIMAFDKSIQYIYNKNNEMDDIGRE